MYDTIIIGSGPAGLFAALELSEKPTHKILIIDKGNDLEQRLKREDKQDSVCGFAGAGAFSDGKLTLNPEIGGNLAEFIGFAETKKLIDEVDHQYVIHGAPDETYEVDKSRFTQIKRAAAAHGLKLVQDVIRHMGTDGSIEVARRMRAILESRGVEFKFNTQVTSIQKTIQVGGSFGYLFRIGSLASSPIETKNLIVAPGRSGSEWFSKIAKELKLKRPQELPVVDIGVRVEVPTYIVEHLVNGMYEPKMIYYSKEYDLKARTFCVCPGGQVALEYHSDGDFYSVNGHSNKNNRTDITNFAILISERFTKPFSQPREYGAALAKLSNMLCDKVIVQRFVDLERGRRSTANRMKRLSYQPTLKECQPGDLSLVMPHRQMTAIKEMMHALSGVAPGLCEEAIMYGLEVKFYSHKYELTKSMETNIPRLFVVGDGSGMTRGLIQASCTGVLAARKILGG